MIQTLRIGRTARHILRARIEGVPDGTQPDTVQDAITNAGLAPSEAGIIWGNHSVTRKPPKDMEIPAAVEPPVWHWSALESPKPRQLNCRISPRLYGELEAAAQAEGVPLRAWVERVLAAAVADRVS